MAVAPWLRRRHRRLVNFAVARAGRSTQLTVHLQYAPPAGKVGDARRVALGREPSQTVREDLRHSSSCLKS